MSDRKTTRKLKKSFTTDISDSPFHPLSIKGSKNEEICTDKSSTDAESLNRNGAKSYRKEGKNQPQVTFQSDQITLSYAIDDGIEDENGANDDCKNVRGAGLIDDDAESFQVESHNTLLDSGKKKQQKHPQQQQQQQKQLQQQQSLQQLQQPKDTVSELSLPRKSLKASKPILLKDVSDS